MKEREREREREKERESVPAVVVAELRRVVATVSK